MNIPPLLRQVLVVSAPQLAALSVGGIVSFPGALFRQLKANDSTIHIDIHGESWIGSTHGLAGILACLTPLFMQYKGRKLSFILSCILGFIGWIIIYCAQSTDTLIVAEVFHGLCTYSLLTSSLQTISEMVQPRFRTIAMNMYFLAEILGMNLVLFAGRYFSWRTISLIECCPMLLALLISLTWPESPSWLAYKGDFDNCETAFKKLRGTDADAEKELNELIRAYKENMAHRKAISPLKLKENLCHTIRMKMMQRDFYVPCLHTILLICSVYWSGWSVIVVYTMGMLQQVTGDEAAASLGVIIIYAITFFGNALGLVLLKVFKTKTVALAGGTGVTFFMLAACILSYLQNNDILPKDSLLSMYCLIGYTVSFNLGTNCGVLSIATELMPVKHRGVGGALFILACGLLDFLALKLSPYLFLYIEASGTFLVYSVNALICFLFIWRYVPETKNRTLQEIEDFYNNGIFLKHSSYDDVLENVKDANRND